MLIKLQKSHHITENDVTPEFIYTSRRKALKQLRFIGASGLLASTVSQQANAGFFDSDKKLFKTTPLSYEADKHNLS